MAIDPDEVGTPRRFGGARDLRFLASNTVSFGIVASAGIAINAILAVAFDVGVVGRFNQLFAMHLVAAQLAAFGVQLSTLHYLSHGDSVTPSWRAGARAAVFVAGIAGSVVGLLLWLCAEPIARLFDSPELAGGLLWLAPAVAVFGINKVMLAICNASGRLHLLALLQALRPMCWFAGVLWLVQVGQASSMQMGQLLLSGEVITLAIGMALLRGIWRDTWSVDCRVWMGRHAVFGLKAMPSNLIVDLNTRIDVLVLAYFASDGLVGVYSFVAMLAEGVFQIGVIIRTVVSRRLVALLADDDHIGLRALRAQAGRWSLWLTLLPVAVLSVAFMPAVSLFGLDPAMGGGKVSLWVLLAGVVVCAVSSPMWMILVLAGRPTQHTQLMLALCALNLILNLTLIPLLGMLGAAIGTAVMLAAFPFMLRWTVRRVLGVIV